MAKVERVCPECNQTFLVEARRLKQGRGKYCSVKCRAAARTGAKNPLWQGGKTRKAALNWRKKYPEKQRAGNRLRVAVFQKKVKKDVCVTCGGKANVHGHHMDYSKPLDVIWLCAACHSKQHPANAPKQD